MSKKSTWLEKAEELEARVNLRDPKVRWKLLQLFVLKKAVWAIAFIAYTYWN